MIKKKVRTYSATDAEAKMLEALAQYHDTTKSGMLIGLLKKEFWRVFPKGTPEVRVMKEAL